MIILDDDADLRTLLTSLIEASGYRSVPCATFEELQETAPRFRSGCILLDVRLPGLDGLAVQEWLIRSGVLLPVIFISGGGDIDAVVQGMKAGAIDFLRKPIPEVELRKAVNAGIAKSRVAHCQSQSVMLAKSLIKTLTPTELRVAMLFAQGYPTKMVAAEMDRSENTIKIHRRAIFTKLKIRSSVSLAKLLIHSDEAL